MHPLKPLKTCLCSKKAVPNGDALLHTLPLCVALVAGVVGGVK